MSFFVIVSTSCTRSAGIIVLEVMRRIVVTRDSMDFSAISVNPPFPPSARRNWDSELEVVIKLDDVNEALFTVGTAQEAAE